MNYNELIVRDPAIVGGQAVLKGTRVTLNTSCPAWPRAPQSPRSSRTSPRSRKNTCELQSRSPPRPLRKICRSPKFRSSVEGEARREPSGAPGSHHGLLLVRLRRPGRAALFERIRQLFAAEHLLCVDGS